MAGNLTKKQFEALRVISEFVAKNNTAPTLVELQPLLNVSSNQAVINYLDVLEEKGYIEREKKARGIRLMKSVSEVSEENMLLNILSEIAERKKAVKHPIAKMTYDNPYSSENFSGRIISGAFNNEQY